MKVKIGFCKNKDGTFASETYDSDNVLILITLTDKERDSLKNLGTSLKFISFPETMYQLEAVEFMSSEEV